MYFSINGKITYVGKDFVVVESNGIGYQIIVARVSLYKIGENATIFLYRIVKEEEEYFVGFSSIEERDAFLMLISVKGIGPKTALGILGNSNLQQLISAIASNNIVFLSNLPGIGKKQASQILLDLQGTYIQSSANVNQYIEVKSALKSMGFKTKTIDSVLLEINIPNASNEEILRFALKRLRK